MFGSVFGKVTSFLDPRFIVNYFLPGLIFWALLIVVWVIGGDKQAEAIAWWGGDSVAHAFQITGFLVWVVIFAYIISSQSESLLRIYEGYWSFPLGHMLQRFCRSWHKRKLARLAASLERDWRHYREIYLGYPLPTQLEEVMPTKLGNILKNAELYPKDRYNIDAVLIWPRLYNLLPQSINSTIVSLRGGLDFMLVISALASLFAFVSGIYLLAVKATPSLFLSSFGGGMLVGYAAYRASLGNALLYAQQIKAAFDLYRNLLLTQMRVPLPQTKAVERATWGELCLLLYRNIPPTSWAYEAPALPSVTAAGLLALLTDNSSSGSSH